MTKGKKTRGRRISTAGWVGERVFSGGKKELGKSAEDAPPSKEAFPKAERVCVAGAEPRDVCTGFECVG